MGETSAQEAAGISAVRSNFVSFKCNLNVFGAITISEDNTEVVSRQCPLIHLLHLRYNHTEMTLPHRHYDVRHYMYSNFYVYGVHVRSS